MRQAVVLLMTILCFSQILHAQSATTSLHGIITDPKGSVIAGAEVTLTNRQTGFMGMLPPLRALSDFHLRHMMNASFVYDLPSPRAWKEEVRAEL
jgi:hypothetical protein